MKYILLLLGLFGDTRGLPSAEVTSSNTLSRSVEITLVTTEQKISRKLLECGVDSFTVKLIIAQARLESGNFSNRLTRDHNNIMSMRHPYKRPTTSLCGCAQAEGRKGYAHFTSIESAVEDYILYMEFSKFPKITSPEQYVRLLKKKGYFESNEKKYLKAIKQLI